MQTSKRLKNPIGKGRFTKVYNHEDSALVYVVSSCVFKECNAFGWLPEGLGYAYFPTIERIAWAIDDKGNSLYTMQKYPKLTSPKKQLNSMAYATYKTLRDVFHAFIGIQKIWDKQKKLESLTLDIALKNFLVEVLDATTNHSDSACFEISPRNVSYDDEGNLVLLDVIFKR